MYLAMNNSAGVPMTLEFTKNYTLVNQGVVSIASNVGATGTTGRVNLPTYATRSLVFIKCSGLAQIIAVTGNSFDWYMAQGTTSFSWFAFNVGVFGTANAGMQAFNQYGELQWELGLMPLSVQVINLAGLSVGHDGGVGTAATLSPTAGGTYSIPSEHAVMLSDLGTYAEIYSPFSTNTTIQTDTRYVAALSTSGGTAYVKWGRLHNNLIRPSGLSLAGTSIIPPKFLITARVPL